MKSQTCAACEYQTGDNSKFVRHQDSSGHMDKVYPVQNFTALRESSTPRFIIMGHDANRLSKDSAEQWLSMRLVTGDKEDNKLDLRP